MAKLLQHIMAFIQYGTRTQATFNESMAIEKADGLIVVEDYDVKSPQSVIYFKVDDPSLLEVPSERCIKDLLRQAYDLGYRVRSLELLHGTKRNIPFLFDTYWLKFPVGDDERHDVLTSR